MQDIGIAQACHTGHIAADPALACVQIQVGIPLPHQLVLMARLIQRFQAVMVRTEFEHRACQRLKAKARSLLVLLLIPPTHSVWH